ncbi:XRE family transcriptional regulator [soil metagenome]
MNQRELADASGIAPSTLSKYENALLPMTDRDADAIATATGFHSSFLRCEEQLIGLGSSLLFNRRLKTTPMPIQRQVQARVNVARIQVERLLRSVELEPSAKLERLDVGQCGGDPRFVAKRVRAAMRLPFGPVQNVTGAIEAVGGVVVMCNFGAREVDGAHIWIPGSPPMFFMNADRPGARHRFSLAHELGHAVMHEFPSGNIEEQANEFAAEFLMPSAEIHRELMGLTIERAADLKLRWKVSMSALIYNAHRLGCIGDNRYRTLYATLRGMLRGLDEPLEIAKEEPVLIRQMIQMHRKTLGYGEDQMRALFMMDDPEFIALSGDAIIAPKRMTLSPMRISDYQSPPKSRTLEDPSERNRVVDE